MILCNRIKLLISAYGCIHQNLPGKFTFLISFHDNAALRWQICSRAIGRAAEVVKHHGHNSVNLCVRCTSSGRSYSLNIKLIRTSWKSLLGAATALHSSRYWAHVHDSVLLSPASTKYKWCTWFSHFCNILSDYDDIFIFGQIICFCGRYV